jgi:hypothetical protein
MSRGLENEAARAAQTRHSKAAQRATGLSLNTKKEKNGQAGQGEDEEHRFYNRLVLEIHSVSYSLFSTPYTTSRSTAKDDENVSCNITLLGHSALLAVVRRGTKGYQCNFAVELSTHSYYTLSNHRCVPTSTFGEWKCIDV